jgi:flavin reductase (DIM6/NTAB) family NADH-FMN oxidoreductase RutF
MDTETFAALMARLDPPVVILTASAAGERSGCLVSFHSQTSMAPTRYCVWVSRANHTWPIARRATHLALHVLDRREHALARLFATTSGDAVDKFSRCVWHAGPGDAPLLAGAAGWFVGTPCAWLEPEGDHAGVVLSPVAAWVAPARREVLRFTDVRHLSPGHAATEPPR